MQNPKPVAEYTSSFSLAAGVTMQWNSSDSSIQVDVQQTLQLLYSGNVAAFYNSELSSSDSDERVSQLRAAVATASSAKTAEVQKLMAEAQKVGLVLPTNFCCSVCLEELPT